MRKWIKIYKKYVLRFLTAAAAVCIGTVCYGGCHDQQSDVFLPLETAVYPASNLQSGGSDGVSPADRGSEDSPDAVLSSDETVCQQIFVYVCGCVKNPDVYVLDAGSRVFEAVEAAGGLTGEADVGSINLALKLEDQMQVYIPSREEILKDSDYPGKVTGSSFGQTTSGDGTAGTVNINTATLSQLDTLPGIGMSKAQDIIDYREAHGAFTKIEELMNIPGIKSGVFDKIKDLVTVD